MLIVALLSLQAVAGSPQITVKKIDGNSFRIEAAAFDVLQGPAIGAAIDERAAALCAGKQVRWEEFSSTMNLAKTPGSTPSKIEGYFQEFSCVEAEQTSYSPAPVDWKASSVDEADVRRVFETYYAKRDQGDMAAALAMFAPGVRGDPIGATRQMREFNQQLGAGKRRIVAVTWYINPDSAEHPGVYAAVDFVGDFASAYFYCGYLVLYRRGPASYEITREEQNIFHRGKDPADPSQLAQMRAGACRGS
jgi:hypothetical protein